MSGRQALAEAQALDAEDRLAARRREIVETAEARRVLGEIREVAAKHEAAFEAALLAITTADTAVASHAIKIAANAYLDAVSRELEELAAEERSTPTETKR